MQPKRTTEQAKAPASAFQFRAEAAFAAAGGEGSKTRKVDILARTGGVAEHWYWGRVVHDMAGMSPPKERIPLDYVHNPFEVIGYANNIRIEGDALRVSGTLTPFGDDDRAAEIIHKGEQGVPYQASILTGFSDLLVEEVPEGMSVTVNGAQFAGPGYVMRRWSLLGLAICPYGADSATAAQFNKSHDSQVSFHKDILMPEVTNPVVEPAATPAGVEATAVPSTPEPTQAANTAPGVDGKPQAFTGADYVTAFGDVGARWFIEGKSFAAASADYVAQLKASHKAEIDKLTAERDEFKAKLDATELGNKPAPVKPAGVGGKQLTGLSRVYAAIAAEKSQRRE